MISKETIEDNKARIIELWQCVQGPDGILSSQVEAFTKWLSESDFFTAPCSTMFHLACKGGLAEHSQNVYYLLLEKVKRFKLDIPVRSILICGLGHDLCKVNFYKISEEEPSSAQTKYLRDLAKYEEMRAFELEGTMTKAWCSKLINWIKEGRKGERPRRDEAYAVDDQLPLGHGEKSVSILQDFFHLTDEEKLAIRWHMAAFDASIHFDYPNGHAFRKAAEIPLVTLLFTSDYEASQILEREA